LSGAKPTVRLADRRFVNCTSFGITLWRKPEIAIVQIFGLCCWPDPTVSALF